MREHLHPWFMRWLDSMRESDRIYAQSAQRQIVFVRDRLGPLVQRERELPEMTHTHSDGGVSHYHETALVINTHQSKSIALPVYEIERPDLGLRLTLRDNFYNWKLSVLSDNPIEADFGDLFYTSPPIEPEYTGNPLHPVYFEGFPKDRIFGYYDQDHRRWSAEVWGTHHRIWAVVWLVMQARGQIKPLTWHTRESHAKELAERRSTRRK